MTGEEFTNTIGPMRKELDNEGNVRLYIENISVFKQVSYRLKVLARAIPSDKHKLIVGLK